MLNHIHLKYLDLLLLLTLTTYTNSTSYLNSFGRYCSLKNPAFWLFKRFLELNWRARFFPDTWFLQRAADRYYFHIQVKKVHLNGSDFCWNPKNLHFSPFWVLLTRRDFFSKNRTWSLLTSCKKSGKNWWAPELQRSWVTNGQTNRQRNSQDT